METDIRVGMVGTEQIGSDSYGFVITLITKRFKSGTNKGLPREVEILFIKSSTQTQGEKQLLSYRSARKKWYKVGERYHRCKNYSFGTLSNHLDMGF